MPYVPPDPADPDVASAAKLVDEFADREEQSAATRASMEFMAEVLRSGREISAYCHVLTFYGGAGTGKTSLSRRLESWIKGEFQTDDWGPRPAIPNVATVRWDLNNSKGDIDVVPLLLSLRAALPAIPGGWKILDLGLLAYFQAVRPGENLDLTTTDSTQRTLMTNAFEAVASDVGYAFDWGTGIAAHAIRAVVTLARKRMTDRQKRRHPRLAELIDRCSSGEVSAASPSPDVAALVLQLAYEQIIEISSPERRPLVVVFIDHFERLQDDGRRLGETTVNHLVGALPECLFVITGRNRLDWDNPARTALPYRGPECWPQLVVGFTERNPRQHRLGMLSEHDTETVFRRRAARQGFVLNDNTISRLVERTHGWPVHIDAICTLAAGLTAGSGAEVSVEELDRPLEDIVRRVLENLTERQRRAFFGACLLPYFNLRLAAVAANVDEGDVAAMISRAMVEPSDDQAWPYRVHDAIRELIRTAPPETGGWTTGDWQAAAHRALAHIQPLLDDAANSGDDLRAIAIGGLAITIAADHGVWDEWVRKVPGKAPAEVLAQRVPTSSHHVETNDLVRHIHARVLPRGEEKVRILRDIFQRDGSKAYDSGLWLAYVLRNWDRIDETLVLLNQLRDRFPDKTIPVSQIGITLSHGRRFVDALAYASGVPAKNADYIRSNQLLMLGDLWSPGVLPFAPRIAAAGTLRFRVELQCYEARFLARTHGIADEEITWRYERAVNVGHAGAQRNTLFAYTCNALGDKERFSERLEALLALPGDDGLHSMIAVEAQALRALVTGRQIDADYARELAGDRVHRNSQWIASECFLDALGCPLDPVPTQWVIPYDEVKANWLKVADGIIARAS